MEFSENYLPETGEIFLSDIEGDCLKNFINELKYIEDNDTFKYVNIYINGFGGSFTDALAIINLIKSSRLKVITTLIGTAQSANFSIFISGDNRIVYDNVIAMIHEHSMDVIGAYSLRESMRKYDDYITEYQINHLIEHSKLTRDEITNKILVAGKETYLTAQELLDYGFADAIQKPVKKKGRK